MMGTASTPASSPPDDPAAAVVARVVATLRAAGRPVTVRSVAMRAGISDTAAAAVLARLGVRPEPRRPGRGPGPRPAAEPEGTPAAVERIRRRAMAVRLANERAYAAGEKIPPPGAEEMPVRVYRRPAGRAWGEG